MSNPPLSANLLREIRTSFGSHFQLNPLSTRLQMQDGLLVDTQGRQYGIYAHQFQAPQSLDMLQALALNCGDTAGADQGLDVEIDRAQVQADYFRGRSEGVYLLNDVALTPKLAATLEEEKLSYIYSPCLFQKDITKSSGFLLAVRGLIEEVYAIFPDVVPQGESAREEHLVELFHPVFLIKAVINRRRVLLGSFYVSSYSNQRQRRQLQRLMLAEALSIAKEAGIEDILLSGDGNAYGWTIPYLPKSLWTLQFLPILLTHALTAGFQKSAVNTLGNQEIKQLRSQARDFNFTLHPLTWSPTVGKGSGRFGVNFMADYAYHTGPAQCKSQVIPGIFPDNDHNAVVSTLNF